jgi:hypothetical protein
MEFVHVGLPHVVLKFAVNSSIDTLPTFTNLRRWGKPALVNCQLCGNMVKQILFHVFVHCKHTLYQGRLTWSPDLNHIMGSLNSVFVGKSTVELYCYLDGLQAPGGGSIPADVMVQTQKPDLVILDRLVHGRHRIALVKLILRRPRNIRLRDLQTSKLLSAMRGGIVVYI